MSEQVDQWILGSSETIVEADGPDVVNVVQVSTLGGYPQSVALTRNEWRRVGKAMGWDL